jgi:hypothetical protein
MLEVPDEFVNDEDGICLKTGDFDDSSKEETDYHTLESNNGYDRHRCCSTI